MASAPNSSESTTTQDIAVPEKPGFSGMLHLPRNVYLLLFFTLGKGFQLSISALTLNYYVHSLGYRPDFIGVFSAMPAVGALIGAVPTGMLADRIGRKPVLLLTAALTPLFLATCGLVTTAPLLLAASMIQGFVSTAYWVTNLPLLTESTTEKQRVGVFALNSFLLLGVGALGNLLGGTIPEFIAGILHVSAGEYSLPLCLPLSLVCPSGFCKNRRGRKMLSKQLRLSKQRHLLSQYPLRQYPKSAGPSGSSCNCCYLISSLQWARAR